MADAVPGPSRETPRTPPSRRIHTLHSAERKIIANVVDCCQREKENKSLLAPLNQALKRATIYTGASIASVNRIKKFKVLHPDQSPETPGKKRTRTRGKILLDDFDKRVMRDTIHDFYTVQKVVPTITKLLPVLKQKINWNWSPSSLRTILKSMGFVWKKVQNKRKLLLERGDIVDWRSRYLVRMKHFREEGREIFYLDESWIDNNMTTGKCWQKENDILGVTSWGSSAKRLIIVSAGSRSGFIAGANLIMEANTSQGDYHGQMNSINFEKWFNMQLLPNIPPASVIVMDNAPYHSRLAERVPSRYDTKLTMIEWLRKRGIDCDHNQPKSYLFDLILANKPSEKVYVIDKMASERGHTVIRLPPYNCDLNPIELAWAKIKRVFREHNVTGDLSVQHLRELTHYAFSTVTSADWKGFCEHIQKCETEYWQKDGILEVAIEDIIVNVAGDTASESERDSYSDDSE